MIDRRARSARWEPVYVARLRHGPPIACQATATVIDFERTDIILCERPRALALATSRTGDLRFILVHVVPTGLEAILWKTAYHLIPKRHFAEQSIHLPSG